MMIHAEEGLNSMLAESYCIIGLLLCDQVLIIWQRKHLHNIMVITNTF